MGVGSPDHVNVGHKNDRQGLKKLVWYERGIDYRDNNRYATDKNDAQKKFSVNEGRPGLKPSVDPFFHG